MREFKWIVYLKIRDNFDENFQQHTCAATKLLYALAWLDKESATDV